MSDPPRVQHREKLPWVIKYRFLPLIHFSGQCKSSLPSLSFTPYTPAVKEHPSQVTAYHSTFPPSLPQQKPPYHRYFVLPVRISCYLNTRPCIQPCTSQPTKPQLSLSRTLAYTTKSRRTLCLTGHQYYTKSHTWSTIITILKDLRPTYRKPKHPASCLTQQTSPLRTAQLSTTSSRCLFLRT